MADQRYIPDVCSRIDFHVGLLQAGAGKERPMKVIKDGNRPARDHLPKLRMLPRGKRTQQPHARAPVARPMATQPKTRRCRPAGWATAASWRTRKSADRTRNEEHGNSWKIGQRKAARRKPPGCDQAMRAGSEFPQPNESGVAPPRLEGFPHNLLPRSSNKPWSFFFRRLSGRNETRAQKKNGKFRRTRFRHRT